MSMNGWFRAVSADVVEQLQGGDEGLIDTVMGFDQEGAADAMADMLARMRQQGPMGVAMAQMLASQGKVASGADAAPAVPLADGDLGPELNVQKDWGALNYLLAGDAHVPGAEPPANAVLGGVEVGEDVGYGPMRLLTVTEVAAVADALRALGIDALLARYDGAAMDAAGVYPGGWSDPLNLDSVAQSARRLVAFYAAARDAGHGVALAIV